MSPPTYAAPLTTKVQHDIYPAISPDGALARSAAGLSVLITGAGRGIGRAQAIAFAKAGASRVTIAARSEDELSEVEKVVNDLGTKCEVIRVRTDVADEQSVQNLFDKAGDVHVLINNAGILETPIRIHEASPTDWWLSYEINVKGTFLPTQHALRLALAKPERPVKLTIINTSSIGSTGTRPGMSAYQSTKSAVNRFTEFVHFEYEEEGVRAFAYHPGGVATKLALGMHSSTHQYLVDTPELAAGYSLWLATSEAADFLRGRYSSANWDIEELVSKRGEIEDKNQLWTRVVGQEQIHDS